MGYVTYDSLYFSTFTIYRWIKLFENPKYIEVLLNAMRFLSKENKWVLFGFVIMPNHIHLFYSIPEPISNKALKHSFLSYTSKQILPMLSAEMKAQFYVKKSDRTYQIWKSPSLSVEINSPKFVRQKLNYIHENPVRAGHVKENALYSWSSYPSYELGIPQYDFLTLWHI